MTSQHGPVKQWGTIGLREPMFSLVTKIKAPYANELNVTDCQTLPPDLTSFAKSKHIHLWASGGGFGPGKSQNRALKVLTLQTCCRQQICTTCCKSSMPRQLLSHQGLAQKHSRSLFPWPPTAKAMTLPPRSGSLFNGCSQYGVVSEGANLTVHAVIADAQHCTRQGVYHLCRSVVTAGDFAC